MITDVPNWAKLCSCGHGMVLHDIEARDEEKPMCCVDDCTCGKDAS